MGGSGVLEASKNTLPCSDRKDSSSKQGQQLTCAGLCHISVTQEANVKATRSRPLPSYIFTGGGVNLMD